MDIRTCSLLLIIVFVGIGGSSMGDDVKSGKGDGFRSTLPLIRAATDGPTREVLRLVKEGADVNMRSYFDTTPLMAAAHSNQIETAKFLIEHGADINATDVKAVNALMFAAGRGHLEMVKLLVAKGAEFYTQTCGGSIISAVHGRAEIVKFLNESGAASRLEEFRRKQQRMRDAVAALLLAQSVVAKQPGFRDCETCPEMVMIPAGSFMMGSPESERSFTFEGPKHSVSESPQYRVTIPRIFAAGKYEVTFDEWDACVAEGGCSHSPNDVWGRGRRPVIKISWDDAKQYVAWLSRKTGKSYRLLTEAEWEYVARAGSTTAFSTGAAIAPHQANYDTTCSYAGSRAVPKLDQEIRTVPVGTYAPNAFGLHEAHGNVSEWVEDCWNESYAGAPADGSAWLRGNCKVRSVRGGGLASRPDFVRSAMRGSTLSGLREHGLRVARTD